MKSRLIPDYFFRICFFIFFLSLGIDASSISIKVGETYTCDIGYVDHLSACFWTISATDVLEFTSTPGSYDTRVTVRAKKAFSSPVVVQCKYYWNELDPMTGRYIYSRSSYKDWTFFVSEDKPQPSSVDLQPSSVTLDMGDTYSISYRVLPSNADQSLTWSCYPSGVVSVNGGFLRTLGTGTTTVTATAVNGVSASCRVTVRNIDPTRVSLSAPSSIYIGQTVTLTPELYPSNAQTTFSWRSNNSTVASVNSSGIVTGKSVGTATITVTTANNLSASCEVEVYKPVPSRIELNKATLRLPVGGKESLTYNVTPSYAIYSVTWESDAPDIVSVNNGNLEAKRPGVANISVVTDNGKKSVCKVTVPPEPTAVSVKPSELELIMGRSKTLTYSFTPADAATLNLSWQSNDPKVATVSQQGVVTALRPGETTLTATTCNGVVGKCELTVPVPLYQLFVWTKAGIKTGYLSTEEPQFNVEGDVVHFSTSYITMDIHRDTLDKFTLEQVLPEHPKAISLPERKSIALGASVQLNLALTPADAQTTLKWFNDNPDVASVTQSGLVKAKKVGEANLMVQTSNGLRARSHIIVPEPCLRFYVWMHNGEVHGYDLEERPEVKLGETIFTLTTEHETIQYQAADILRFTLQDAVIEEEITDKVFAPVSMSDVQFREGTLLFADCSPNSPVQVYDTAGRMVQTAQTDGDGNLSLSLESLNAGVYIIRTKQTTIKIKKR